MLDGKQRPKAVPPGIPLPGFTAGLLRGDIATLTGSHCDDIISAIDEYPTWNSYWKNHAARLDKILCPMYVVSSWTNLLHVSGTFRGWEKSASKEKWLRVHDSHEWPGKSLSCGRKISQREADARGFDLDLYEPSNVEDLRRFYDYYMKGINNGWEFTPKVRLCVLNPSGRNVVNRPETSFPLARQQPLKLYLHAVHMSLTRHPPAVEGTFSYDAGSGSAVFKMVVEDRFEFTGYIKARLWAEAIGSDDMDVFVFLQKFDRTTGQVLESVVVDVARLADDPEVERQGLLDLRAKHKDLTQAYFDDGPFGCLRASHRALDDKESTEFHPVYKHEKEDLLRPGEVVALDIAFWPYGMIFEQGEEMRITVTGTHYKLHLRPEDVRPVSRNHGTHKFYTGPERQSYILLPLIPSVSHRPEAS